MKIRGQWDGPVTSDIVMKWVEMLNEFQIFAVIELIELIVLNGKPLLLLRLFSLMGKWETAPIIALIQLNGTN